MSELNNRERSLVSLGAAIAANCIPCIEFHIPDAKNSGLSESEIKEAVEIAAKVRRVPAWMIMQTALARIEVSASEAGEKTAAGCCCAGPSDSDCVS
jgi:4-carboxymuconolactone decarboxylase